MSDPVLSTVTKAGPLVLFPGPVPLGSYTLTENAVFFLTVEIADLSPVSDANITIYIEQKRSGVKVAQPWKFTLYKESGDSVFGVSASPIYGPDGDVFELFASSDNTSDTAGSSVVRVIDARMTKADVTHINGAAAIDTVALDVAISRMLAFADGKTVLVDNLDGTFDLQFKDQDGVTTRRTHTFNLSGERISIT